MPDIRMILEALSPEDRVLWSQHRTEMRRSYITAHSTTVSVAAWDAYDDAFLDLIDIKLAILFERAGKFNTARQIVETDKQIEKIESDIHNIIKQQNEGKTRQAAAQNANQENKGLPHPTPYAPGDAVKDRLIAESQATALMRNDWTQNVEPVKVIPSWPNGATK